MGAALSDQRLVVLAKHLGGKVVTNDYNLNRVAELSGVSVLNINELANALKPVVLPGEPLHVHIVKEGKEANQGVAYLDDGTMVVVEHGKRLIGQTARLEFKLVDPTGDNVWWSNNPGYVFGPEWKTFTRKKRQISFAWGPIGGGDMKQVAGIEFAITAGSGGKGTVWIDDFELRTFAIDPDGRILIPGFYDDVAELGREVMARSSTSPLPFRERVCGNAHERAHPLSTTEICCPPRTMVMCHCRLPALTMRSRSVGLAIF